jgi:transcriptional regulator GlxA family with amidase domain
MSPPVVAVIAFDHISPFHLAVPCVVFGDAHPGTPTFELIVCAAEEGPLRTSAGFDIQTHHGLAALARADIVIVPSWRDPAEKPAAALLAALVAAHERGAWVVGLCVGAYVLAEAGLLAQRQATTHWAYAEDFARRYPNVQLDPDVLYVEDGNLLTSAGTAAGIDCCLHLLRGRYGSEVANKVARRLVVPPHRQGGQRQFVEQPVPNTNSTSKLSVQLDHIRASLDQPHSLETLAAKAAMSRRTLTRQFKQLTGLTFGEWLQGERLARSQHLLESTNEAMENIAAAAGFGSSASFRLHFQRAFGVSPSAWRQTFRGH